MFYINTLKRELVDTYAYKLQPSLSKRVIVDEHGCHTALNFSVKAKQFQDKVPTLYWLPKLHKKPIRGLFKYECKWLHNFLHIYATSKW